MQPAGTPGDDPGRVATEQALRQAMARTVQDVGDVPDLVERMHARAGVVRRRRRAGAVAGALTALVALTGIVVRPPWAGHDGSATIAPVPATAPTEALSAPVTPSGSAPAPTAHATSTSIGSTAASSRPAAAATTTTTRPPTDGTPAGPWAAVTVDDDFTTAPLDTGRWTPYSGSSGSPETVWSPDVVSVHDGALRLTVERVSTTTPAARAGGVKLAGDGARYGRWEVRWRMTAGHGVTGQFLMLGEGPGGIGQIATLQPAEHRLLVEDLVRGTSTTVPVDGAAYHVLAMESTPTGVRWLLDGRRVVDEPGGAPVGPVVAGLQALVQGSDCGRIPLPADCTGPATLPQHLDVDRFRFWPYQG